MMKRAIPSEKWNRYAFDIFTGYPWNPRAIQERIAQRTFNDIRNICKIINGIRTSSVHLFQFHMTEHCKTTPVQAPT